MEQEEIWKPVVGYEGLYSCSSLGRVRSEDKIVKNYRGEFLRKGSIKALANGTKGYQLVCLCKDGKQKTHKVHRLVAEAFIPNPDNLPQVGHNDECKTNNQASNLYWTTAKENNNHGKYNERVSKAQLNRKDLSKRVYQYTLDGEFITKYPSIQEAERCVGSNHVGCVCIGRYKSTKGFIFKYADDVDKEKGVA